MTLDRRELLKGLSGLAASVAFARLNGAAPLEAASLPSSALPRKQDFDISDGYTYLNAAYTHPIPRPAADAARAYLAQRSKLVMPRPGSGGGAGEGFNAKALFAELINAKTSEIASSIITFARKGLGASDMPQKLARERVSVRIADHWMRVSPSIYNDMADIDRLIEALA